MYTAEQLKADILSTAKFAAATQWRGELVWERHADLRPYSVDQLSPAGREAFDALRRGDTNARRLAMCDFEHWDGVIFSTLAMWVGR